MSYTTETTLLGIAAALNQLTPDQLQSVIKDHQGSDDPDDLQIKELAALMKKVKPMVEKIDCNWHLRFENQFSRETEKPSETTTSDEFINNESEAA